MNLVVDLGTAKGLLTNLQVDDDEMQIVDAGNRMNLRNIYASFLRAPRRERLAFLENALSMQTAALKLPERWEDIRPLLRPVLRDAGYLTITQLRMQAEHAEAPRPLAYQELAPGLFVTLGIDMRHAMALVAGEELETWGVDFETTQDLASYTEERALRRALDGEAYDGNRMVIEGADGTLRSRVVWTEGGADRGYLPPAQAITFVKLDEATLQPAGTWDVPWEVVVQAPGMLTRTDAPLPRWKTGAFPSDEWLAQHATRAGGQTQAAS